MSNQENAAYVARTAYEHVEYPKWVHHPTLGSKIINSEDDFEDGWYETFAEAQSANSETEDEKSALIQLCEERGLQIDKRWSLKRLHELLDANPPKYPANESQGQGE